MRVKAASILAAIFLCLSLLPVVSPPLASPVKANPMETLTVTWTMTSAEPCNWRPHNLQSGDEVVQFGRPNLVVGTNPYGGLSSVQRESGTVSGDFNGTGTAEFQGLDVWWDELGLGVGRGYVIAKSTLSDGQGNSISAVMVADCDFTSPSPGTVNVSFDGFGVSTSGTGTFSDQILIGHVSGSGTSVNQVMTSHAATMVMRRYSGAEISGPIPMSGTGTGTGTPPPFRSLGLSQGQLPSDEYIQFSRTSISMPLSTSAIYVPAEEDTPVTLTGGLSGTIVGIGGASLHLPATAPSDQGWIAGVSVFQGNGGSFKTIGLHDALGLTAAPATHTFHGYAFALMEDATGTYAGKDYYVVSTATSNWATGEVSTSGHLYTMTPSGGIPTATGTGIATLVPSSGVMENLVAVAEASMPSEGKPDIQFPHGLFEFEITGLASGQSVTLTLTLPSAVPTTAAYWKYGPTPSAPSGEWYQVFMGDNDGDNVITITLTDGGLGDDDLIANGTIVDQGGPGWPGPSGGGGSGVPVFPSIYVGIGAALGTGLLAYFLRRRMVAS